MGKATKRKPKVAAVTVRANKARTKPKPKEKRMSEYEKDKGKAEQAPLDKPAKTTAAPPEPLAGGTAGAYSETTVSVPPEDMLTEQEKDTSSDVPGVGPASASETTTGPAETIEDLGIGPREPYPTGGAPASAPEGTATVRAAVERKKEPFK